MATTRMEYFRSELKKIRVSMSGGVSREEIQTEGQAVWSSSSPRPGGRHAVPSQMHIVDLMEGDLATVHPETPIRSAVALMIDNRISSVPVVDADRRIMGALNEGDLMKVFYEPDTRCVADVMTLDPPAVAIDAPLVDVIDRLMSTNFRRVLIHENDRLVGVITRSHVMPALLSALEQRAAVLNSEVEPH